MNKVVLSKPPQCLGVDNEFMAPFVTPTHRRSEYFCSEAVSFKMDCIWCFWTVVFVISILMAMQFGHWGTSLDGFISHVPWMNSMGITLDLGVDSVAMMLVLLTTLAYPALCVGFIYSNHSSESESITHGFSS